LPVYRIDDEARRAVAILGIHVIVPEIERLQDVTIGVDDVIDAAHQLSSADENPVLRHRIAAVFWARG